MNNDDVLRAFKEWLRTQGLPVGITAPEALGLIGEFAKAIDPVPLNEATDQDINAFLRADVTDVNARSLVARTGAKVRISYNQGQIEYAIVRFRKFRNSVLKNLPKDKTQ